MWIYKKMEDSGMPIDKSGIDEQTRIRLNSKASLLARSVTKKIRELMNSKVSDFGIFNIVMEPISFSIKFVVFNAFGILIEYSNDSLQWYRNGKDGKKQLDSTRYDLNEIDLLCMSIEDIVKKQLPEKYFRAYGWL